MPAYLCYKVVSGDCFVWEHGRGNSVTAPVNISTLAAASLGAGSDAWASVSWNGEWIIIRTSRADGAGWDALYIASMATFPASLDFHAVKVNTWNYNPSSIHRVSNDGLTVYGIYDSDSDQVSKFVRASTAVYDFVPTTMYSGTNYWEMVSLSLDETYLTVAVGNGSDFYRVNTAAPYTATLLFDVSTQAIHTTHSSSPTSDNRLVFEGDGAGGDESTYVLQTLNPSESYTDISGVGNDNDPFCLANDNNLVVSLYLSRPGNSSSAHELIFRDIDGANEVAPASFHGVNVMANTISGFTLSPGGVDGSGDATANDAIASGAGQKIIIGGGDATAASASAAGAGTIVGPVTGAGAPTANDAVGSGAGIKISVGSGAGIAADASASGAGAKLITGTGSATADNAAAVGSGSVVGGSTGAGVAIAADASAAGTGGKTAVGSGAAQADSATASGAGNKAVIGSGSPVAISSTASGTGAAVGISTGIGNVYAGAATASGAGTKQAAGSGSAVVDAATASGAGGAVGVVTGTGDAIADNATAIGAGSVVGVSTGVGDATADSATATGAGAKTAVGAGAAIAGTATASGSGWRYIVSAGDVFADTATAYGTDVIPVTITGRNIIFARRPDTSIGAINRRTETYARGKL